MNDQNTSASQDIEVITRRNVEELNEATQKIERARTQRSKDELNARIEVLINWFKDQAIELVNVRDTYLTKADFERRKADMEKVRAAVRAEKPAIMLAEAKRALALRLQSEIEAMQQALAAINSGDERRLPTSRLFGSNHTDLLKLAAQVESLEAILDIRY